MVTDVQETSRLVRLGSTNLTVSDPQEDIRGRSVVDRYGEEFGHVASLLIDEREAKVRFLEIASCGIMGIGEEKFLLPVDAVTRIEGERVMVDQTGGHVAGSPAYDPDLTHDRGFYDDVYGYYGYPPYWGAGYAYPPYPYYP